MSDLGVEIEPPVGMIAIRCDLEKAGSIGHVLGIEFPGRLGTSYGDGRTLLWFSPDELLLLCPRDEATPLAAAVDEALTDRHRLVADVSDARVMFRISGTPGALRDALAKLTPADMRLAAFPEGMVRRTRLAQVPAAIWFAGAGEARVLVFRSVGDYAKRLLDEAARPGSDVGYFA